MAMLTVRNLSDEVHRALRVRAGSRLRRFQRTAARRAEYSSSVKGSGSLFGTASVSIDIALAA